MVSYLSIALPLPVQKVFTYRYEYDRNPASLLGCRALVPFGKRILTGVIVGLGEPVQGMKDIIEILDETPFFTEQMLQLTRKMADYYLCSWGEALKAGIPRGMTPQSVMHVELTNRPTPDELRSMQKRAPKRAALLGLLMDHSGPLTEVYLEKMLKTGSVSDQLDALENAGVILTKRNIEPSSKPRMQSMLYVSDALMSNHDTLKELLNHLDTASPKQAAILSHVYLHQHVHHSGLPVNAVKTSLNLQSSSAIQTLCTKGILIQKKEEFIPESSDVKDSLARRDESLLTMTMEQQHAHAMIHSALHAKETKTFLLHGITGSGKTLVYIQAIRSALSLDKDCLLLVPEISLTPQLVDRFSATFGDLIAVLHSKMTNQERYEHWRKIRSGKARIVIGARSALFAPFRDQRLGLIIVDEEHESSYKQEAPAPRYNARDFAVVRGAIEQVVTILGSATPSMESMYNAQQGKYHYLHIPSRADGAILPKIDCIDIREHRKRGTMQGSFSEELLQSIIHRVIKKEGTILFHNRRGFARFQECLDCGHIPMCKHCSVSLTLHKNSGMVRCHYCGYAEKSLNSCTVCGGTDIKEAGTGTQKVEEELQELLSSRGIHAHMARMDLDSTSKKGEHRRLLTAFAKKEIDILIGTQMVAKGLDFPHVSLVGIVDADHQLFMPDFRSSERTFQLLTQVAGRAGRTGALQGEVLLQTSHPEHQSIIASLTGSYELLYNDELQIRKEANYPPFSRIVTIETAGPDEYAVHEAIQKIASLLPTVGAPYQLLGPTIPFIAKLKSHYRRILVLKGNKHEDPSGELMRRNLRKAMHVYAEQHAKNSVKITIDVDAHHSI
ncbi:MAG: primosomal protein N' [Ignavibacteria bacterium]